MSDSHCANKVCNWKHCPVHALSNKSDVKAVEVFRIDKIGMHIRIYKTEYCLVETDSLDPKEIPIRKFYRKVKAPTATNPDKMAWLEWEPTPKVLAIITEKWGDYWEKVNRQIKHEQAAAFYDKNPNYQNNREQKKNISLGLGGGRFVNRHTKIRQS